MAIVSSIDVVGFYWTRVGGLRPAFARIEAEQWRSAVSCERARSQKKRRLLYHHFSLSLARSIASLNYELRQKQEQEQEQEQLQAMKKKKKKGVVNRKPHFFKVLLGDFTHHLRIPPKFLKHISGVESKRAILRGPSGGKWHVELGRSTKDTFLTRGWRKFVKDHSLKEYEFLVFQYDGNMHFTVLIFDTSACEREDAFAVKPWRKPVQSQGKKKGARVSCTVKQEAAEQCLSLQITEHEAQETKPMQLLPYLGNGTQEMCVASPAAAARNGKVKTEECELPIRTIREKSKCKKIYISTRRLVTEEEKLKAQQAANAFTSPFPYIVVRMTPTHVYRPYLNVPNRFSRQHLPPKKSSIVLRDPSGRSWAVNYSPSLRCQIAKGWTAFVRANKLEEGDFCALELVGPVELRVHIFRVVEEAPPVAAVPTSRDVPRPAPPCSSGSE